MKYKKYKKSAYLTGYQNLSLNDELIKGSMDLKWKSDWEKTGKKKPYNYSDDLIRKGKMYTDTDILFRYSLNNIDTKYEDPTWLGFDVLFDSENSPLFNYSDFPPTEIDEPKVDEKKKTDVNAFSEEKEKQKAPDKTKTGDANTLKKENIYATFDNPSPISFIKKYENIPEIKKREPIYFNFMYTLDSLFKRTYSTSKFSKAYYIESITGLDKMAPVKMVDYEKEKITIQLTEDVSLRSSYLAELYNNLIYSYKNQRYLIPENCLRFDMMISVTDMRVFKYLETVDGELKQKINNDPPRIIYTLHDCNFDFSNSIPFQSTITVGGIDAGKPSNSSILKFDIKYKSISKNFRSSLIYGSLEIHNKLDELVNSKILTRSEMFDYNIKSEDKITIEKEQDNFSNSENLGTEPELEIVSNDELLNKDIIERKKKIESLYENNPILFDQEGSNLNGEGKKFPIKPKSSPSEKLGDFAKGLGSQLKESAIENVDAYKDKLISRYNDIRGELLQDMLRQIRQPLNLPRIYPDNVYSTDFRSLSLETFGKGLGSSLLNDVLDAGSNAILGATNIPS